MKIRAFVSMSVLLLLSLATAQLATAQTGSATGQMLLSDEAKFTIQDVDGTGEKEVTHPGFYIKADFDALVVDKNLAVMSGTVRDSSVREFIGQRVLLTVED